MTRTNHETHERHEKILDQSALADRAKKSQPSKEQEIKEFKAIRAYQDELNGMAEPRPDLVRVSLADNSSIKLVVDQEAVSAR